MTMYLNLTNASPQHRGTKLAIERSLVVTAHTSLVTRDDGVSETVTFLFCPPHGTWEVQESFEQVLKQLNKA
jgi:hypothetical protein